jgi:hypothetical protein
VQHNQRRSQRRSANNRFSIDTTGNMPPEAPRPRSAATDIPNQDGSSRIQRVALAPADTGVVSPLSGFQRTRSAVQTRTTRTVPTLPPVQSVGDQSSINVSLASTDADPHSHQGSNCHDSPVSLFPADQDIVSGLAPDDSIADCRVPIPQVSIPAQDPMHYTVYLSSI